MSSCQRPAIEHCRAQTRAHTRFAKHRTIAYGFRTTRGGGRVSAAGPVSPRLRLELVARPSLVAAPAARSLQAIAAVIVEARLPMAAAGRGGGTVRGVRRAATRIEVAARRPHRNGRRGVELLKHGAPPRRHVGDGALPANNLGRELAEAEERRLEMCGHLVRGLIVGAGRVEGERRVGQAPWKSFLSRSRVQQGTHRARALTRAQEGLLAYGRSRAGATPLRGVRALRARDANAHHPLRQVREACRRWQPVCLLRGPKAYEPRPLAPARSVATLLLAAIADSPAYPIALSGAHRHLVKVGA
mmetsp:Transcript_14414/g.47106  ORF Transcript_14414/g.47106 Transcript_14414/m.47106 type:complete len:302 (-) Transcript_14414:703-1608(-)